MKAIRVTLCVAAAIAMASMAVFLAIRAPSREPVAFPFVKNFTLADACDFEGEPLDLSFYHEAGRPEAFRYLCKAKSGMTAPLIRIDTFYFKSGNAEGRSLFGKFAQPQTDKNQWTPATESDEEGRSWLAAHNANGTILAARIDPQGRITAGRRELWTVRARGWRQHPSQIFNWLFSSEQLVDRRGLWIEAVFPNDVSRASVATPKIWPALLDTFAQQMRDSLGGH